MTIEASTAVALAEMRKEGAALAAVNGRTNIFDMTQVAEEAVLRPKEAGIFPHPARAHLAERIARNAGDDALARHYAPGKTVDDQVPFDPALWSKVTSFVDKVGDAPRDVTASEIAALRDGGLGDADIVRLCELIAFVAYQVRVIAGLRLMERTP